MQFWKLCDTTIKLTSWINNSIKMNINQIPAKSNFHINGIVYCLGYTNTASYFYNIIIDYIWKLFVIVMLVLQYSNRTNFTSTFSYQLMFNFSLGNIIICFIVNINGNHMESRINKTAYFAYMTFSLWHLYCWISQICRTIELILGQIS